MMSAYAPKLRRWSAVRSRFRTTGYAAATLLLLWNPGTSGAASLEREVTFRIPAQPLDTALMEFARQADVQLAIDATSLTRIQAHDLSGKMAASTALTKLLDETGLSYHTVGNTVTVTRVAAASERANLRVAAAAETGSAPVPTTAAEANDTASIYDLGNEVIVTAQRREQRLQDVGIAITALSGEELRAMRINDSTALAQSTPNLSLGSPQGEGQNPVFSIRGVGLNDFSEHNEAPIAIYVDDVYLSNLAGLTFQLFDLDRVEVLKGPQGTLFGRNTTGGVIHFVTRKPSDTFSVNAELSGGERNMMRFEGGIGGPIAEGVAFRLAGLYNNADGYMPVFTPGLEDAGQADSQSVRGQLRLTSIPNLTINVSGHYDQSNIVQTAYSHAAVQYGADGTSVVYVPDDAPNANCPGAPGTDCFGYKYQGRNRYGVEPNQLPFVDLTTWGVSSNVDYDLGGATLTSVTAYERVRKLYGEDTDTGPTPAIYVMHPNLGKQFTQELRLAGDVDRLQYTLGGYYFDRSIDAGSHIDASGIDFVNLVLETWDRIESWALFGQTEFQLTDTVALIGGLRYTDEKRHFQQLSRDIDGVAPFIAGLTPTITPGYVTFDFTDPTVGDLTRQSSGAVTYRAEVDWKPNSDLLVYGSITKGTKGAGFNSAFDGTGAFGNSQVSQIRFGAEKLTSYESGFKWSFLDRIGEFNASAFYYDYDDFQAFTFENITQVIRNRPAKLHGLDADLTLRPVTGLMLSAGVGLLDSKVENVSVRNNATGAIVTRDRQMPLAPEWKVSGLVRYSWDMMGGTMSAQANGQYQGESYFDLDNNPVTREKAYGTLDLRLAYTDRSGRYEFALWGKNVTNTYYRTYAFPVASLGFMDNVLAAPSWFGASLSYKLD